MAEGPLGLTADSSFHDTLGAIEIGVLVYVALFGIVSIQCYVYYSNFQNDPLRVRLVVPGIWICALGQLICEIHGLYTITVSNFGRLERLLDPPKSMSIAVFFGAFLTIQGQLFFAVRVYNLSKRRAIPIIIAVVSVIYFIGEIAAGSLNIQSPNLETFAREWGWLHAAVLGVGTLLDCLITGSLVFYLARQRRGISQTTMDIVDKLIMYTIQTGGTTTAALLAQLICTITMRDTNLISLGILMTGSGLFANSVFASLNARVKLRAIRSSENHELSSPTLASTMRFSPNTKHSNVTETFPDSEETYTKNRGIVSEDASSTDQVPTSHGRTIGGPGLTTMIREEVPLYFSSSKV